MSASGIRSVIRGTPVAIEHKLMTADQLFRLPRDGRRHELVRGELRTMPPSGFEHGDVTGEIGASLRTQVHRHGLGRVVVGDVGFQLVNDPDTVRAPDVAFVRAEKLAEVGRPRGYWPGAPDLAVEVVCPNDLYTEVDEKVAEWLEYGARMVLVVNPRRRTVAVQRPGQPVRILGEDDVLDGEDVVPGWSVRVLDLFGSQTRPPVSQNS
jgi:Uma2 family endonuclease